MLISINCPSLVTSWVVVQKIYSKMYLFSCTNTHHDVTDSVNYGMVKNTKTWISWTRNIIFLRNQKILNLCLRWHILRSYRFVAEVTLNTKQCPAGISPRTIPGRIPANSQKFTYFPTKKILLDIFTFPTIKRFIPSTSNSNFHLIIFLISGFIYMHMSC